MELTYVLGIAAAIIILIIILYIYFSPAERISTPPIPIYEYEATFKHKMWNGQELASIGGEDNEESLRTDALDETYLLNMPPDRVNVDIKYDLGDTFMNSREIMGAGGLQNRHRNPRLMKSDFNEPDKSLNESSRIFMLGKTKCNRYCKQDYFDTSYEPEWNKIYNTNLGLTHGEPSSADCEYIGNQGYVYKEPC